MSREIDRFVCRDDITLTKAMLQISDNRQGVLYVVNDVGRIIGSVSDGDIRRSLVRDGNMNKLVREVMNTSPLLIKDSEKAEDIEWGNCPRITALPVVNDKGQIKNIILRDPTELVKNNEILADVNIVIMAGGKGTRLYPYTKILPKPLIPIGDIPIIERIIDKYVDFGAKNFYITVNYKRGMIKSYFEEIVPSYSISFVDEDMPLGTAGSLKLIEDDIGDAIFVANCDTLINADYADIYNHHIETNSALTIVTALKKFDVPYGVLNVGDGGVIKSMEEKPSMSYFINTGMYVLDTRCIDLIPQEEMYHMPQLAEKLLSLGQKVTMYPVAEDDFLDMGEFEEMKRMEEKLEL